MPGPIGLFALFVIAMLFMLSVTFIVWIGSLPARIARRRDHPQVDAINALSWLGLLFGGVGWGLALVWALIRYDSNLPAADKATNAHGLGTTAGDLESRIVNLEQQLKNSTNRENKS